MLVGLREFIGLSAFFVVSRVQSKFLSKQAVAEVSRHIVASEGAENVVDVRAENSSGFSESVVRTVKGNSRALGFDVREFQDVEW